MKLPQRVCVTSQLVILVMSFSLAQGQTAKLTPDGGRSELKAAAAKPEVKEELESPDGVSLTLLPDGGWRLLGQGTETYDFNEPDDIRVASQAASLRAKAQISKFLKERIKTMESIENLTTKLKTSSAASGKNPESEVVKHTAQTTVEHLASDSESILRGLVTISSEKTPMNAGGTITVVVGLSSKTEAVTDAIRAGQRVPSPNDDSSTSKEARGTTNKTDNMFNKDNLPEKKKSKTDF